MTPTRVGGSRIVANTLTRPSVRLGTTVNGSKTNCSQGLQFLKVQQLGREVCILLGVHGVMEPVEGIGVI